LVTSTIAVDAFLADSVAVADGKIYAQGAGWNVINTRVLPTAHDRIGIGIIVRVPYTSTNQLHRWELRLEGADGQQLPLGDNPAGEGKVRAIGGQFNVGRPPMLQPGDEQVVPFAMNVNGLPFEQAGAYRFVVSVDGSDVKELPFRVFLLPDPQPIIKMDD